MLTTDKFSIRTLLEKIKSGEIQLPDFQRDWVWEDKQIKALLESVIRGFPINSILLLEYDANNIKLSYRPIAGVDENSETKPQYLILDGQQRLTALYGALLAAKPVESKKGKKFFYYVDMMKAIDYIKNSSDSEDMIISVPENDNSKNKKLLDLSNMFPLNKVIDSFPWLSSYQQRTGNIESVSKFSTEIIQKILDYQIVYIKLDKNTPLEAVCKIFEKVNISGIVLTIFDLLTAIFASHKKENGKYISLRTDWKNIKENVFNKSNLDVLKEIESTDFTTALTLLISYENFRTDKKNPVGCNRKNILSFAPTDYLKYKDKIVDGFIDAGKLLEEQGITKTKYLPYKPQLIPLAALLAELKILKKLNVEEARDKVRQWYWCGVFGEAYRDGHLSRFAKDIVQVVDWINSKEIPEIISNTQIVASYILKLKNTKSAVFKGIISIVFKNEATDFLSGRVMALSANHDENIDVHHIFPNKYCEENKFPQDVYDSILNKTPISSETNKIIGQKAPSVYIGDFEKQGNKPQQINNSLKSHFIDPALCRADDFDAFIDDRAKKIFDEIEKLTGRQIVGR